MHPSSKRFPRKRAASGASAAMRSSPRGPCACSAGSSCSSSRTPSKPVRASTSTRKTPLQPLLRDIAVDSDVPTQLNIVRQALLGATTLDGVAQQAGPRSARRSRRQRAAAADRPRPRAWRSRSSRRRRAIRAFRTPSTASPSATEPRDGARRGRCAAQRVRREDRWARSTPARRRRSASSKSR